MFNRHRVLTTVTVVLWGPKRYPPVPAEPLLGIPTLWGSLPAPGLQASSLSKSFQGDASGTVSLCDSCKCYKRPAHVIQTEKNWSVAFVGPCVGKLPQGSPLLCCFQCMLIKELEGKPELLSWECLFQQRDAFSSRFEPGVTSFQPSTECIFVNQSILVSSYSPGCADYFEQISFQMEEFNIFPVTNKNAYIQ